MTPNRLQLPHPRRTNQKRSNTKEVSMSFENMNDDDFSDWNMTEKLVHIVRKAMSFKK